MWLIDMWPILGMLWCVTGHDISRLNAGVYFEFLGDGVRPINDIVTVNYNVKLQVQDTIPLISNNASICANVTLPKARRYCVTLQMLISNLELEMNEHANSINKLRSESLNMMSLFTINSQDKRAAFLQPVGNFIGGLFGMATSTQLEEVTTYVKQNYQNSLELSGNVASFHDTLNNLTSVTNQRFTNIWHTLNATMNVNNKFKEIINNHAELLKILDQHVKMLDNREIILHNLALLNKRYISQLRVEEYYKLLLRSLDKLREQKIPHEIITLDVLSTVIEKVKVMLNRNGSQLRPTGGTNQIHKLYKLPAASANIYGDALVIHTPVPVSNIRASFTLYKILNIGSPLPSKLGYSVIDEKSLPAVLAVDQTESVFTFLTNDDATSCLNIYHGFCSKLTNIKSKHDHNCAVAVYFGNTGNIHKFCNFVVFPNKHMPPLLLKLQNGRYLLNELGPSISVNCPEGSKSIQIERQQLMSVPCNCHLTSEIASTLPSIMNCGYNGQIVSKFTYNLGIGLHYNFTKHLDFEAASKLMDRPIQLRIPDLDNLQATLTKDSQKDENYKLRMSDIVRQSYIDQTKWTNQLNPFTGLNFDAGLNIDISDIVLYIVVLGIIGGLIYAHYRITAVTLLLMTEVEDTVAVVWSYTPTPKQQIGPSVTEQFIAEYGEILYHSAYVAAISLSLVSLCLSVNLITKIAYKLWPVNLHTKRFFRLFLSPRRYNTELAIYLRCSNPDDFTILYLCSAAIERPMSNILKLPDNIRATFKIGCPVNYLKMTYNRQITIVRSGVVSDIELPEFVHIPLTQSAMFRKLMAFPSNVVYDILIKTPEDDHYISQPTQLISNKPYHEMTSVDSRHVNIYDFLETNNYLYPVHQLRSLRRRSNSHPDLTSRSLEDLNRAPTPPEVRADMIRRKLRQPTAPSAPPNINAHNQTHTYVNTEDGYLRPRLQSNKYLSMTGASARRDGYISLDDLNKMTSKDDYQSSV